PRRSQGGAGCAPLRRALPWALTSRAFSACGRVLERIAVGDRGGAVDDFLRAGGPRGRSAHAWPEAGVEVVARLAGPGGGRAVREALQQQVQAAQRLVRPVQVLLVEDR